MTDHTTHRSPSRWGIAALALLGAVGIGTSGANALELVGQAHVFLDETAQLRIPSAEPEAAFRVRLLERQGWQPEVTIRLPVVEGCALLPPLGEGLHAVRAAGDDAEVRFLGMAPPAEFAPQALQAALPRQASDLLAGKPLTLVAMGDSVTATGNYAAILKRLLERATGNTRLSVVRRAYPGRSVDAAVRHFHRDTADPVPHIGLLMYGLNDQSCGVPLASYLSQCRWIVRELAELGADTVLLQPTPHIRVATRPDELELYPNPPEFALRTIGFAEALDQLGGELRVPVAKTFQAIWQEGGATIPACAKLMRPFYPPHYKRRWESLIETGGNGDTIHPNTLGHLQIARAVYRALACAPEAEALQVTAESRLTRAGLHTDLRLHNTGATRRTGTIRVWPLSESGTPKLARPGDYDLPPGGTTALRVDWPDLGTPASPTERLYALSSGNARLAFTDTSSGRTQPGAVELGLRSSRTYQRERQVVEGGSAPVTMETRRGPRTENLHLPPGTQAGRIPLAKSSGPFWRRDWALAELAYTQAAGALPGTAVIDGDLGEWEDAPWSVLGLPCQARWTAGPEDNRERPEACLVHWSVKAGSESLAVALRVQGDVQADRLTMFFDPRPPEKLGTAGPYYWLNASFAKDGAMRLRPGETSPKLPGLQGRWQPVPGGRTAEFAVPYALMDATCWPESGDLGASLWWVHTGANGLKTRLLWAEDSHPWNPIRYGIVRKIASEQQSLPYIVRLN